MVKQNKPQKAKAKPAPQQTRKPKRRLQSQVTHPYLKCLAGPTSMVSNGVGFPDGDPRKSIVVDFKSTYTISPTNGTIRFALVSSPLGCLALNCGIISTQVNVPQYAGTTSLAYNWVAVNPSLGTTNSGWYILPFAENASYLLDGTTMGAYAVGSYRGLMYTADSYFTGTTMANGGVVRVARFNVSQQSQGDIVVNTVTVNRVTCTDLNTPFSSDPAGRYTGPARAAINLRAASAKPTFKDTNNNTVGNEVAPYGLVPAGGVNNTLPFVGLDEEVPVTVVEYTGLDSTASITIEIRSCLELTPRPGSMSAFAKASPPADLSVWQRVANFARSIPTATVANIAGKTALGYAKGGAAGALAAMATSLM